MKTKLLLIGLLTLGFATMQAQAGATVYAKNSDISDNLDLRAVASIFGESSNLQDFERRLNEPKYQISNLDLNGDNQVDYLRVIESVENRTHVVIIQAVLDQDVYQDVATIDLERDSFNKVHIQVVGNDFLYGQNYIYEPVYTVTPVIYTSFWVTNYRPYYSSWRWNYYPTYYTAWRPYPIYRYRSNINICINVNNHYNYVNHRRSSAAVVIYNSNRSYGYERRNPNNGFAQRNNNVSNRYELDQRRVASRETNTRNNSYSNRTGSNTRDYSQNRTSSSRENNTTVRPTTRDYSQNRTTSTSTGRTEGTRDYSNRNTSQRTETGRDYNQGRPSSTVATTPTQRTETTRDYSQNRPSSTVVTPTQRTETTRDYSQNRGNASRDYSSQRTESSRGNSENRTSSSRQSSPQGYENQRSNSGSRDNSGSRESGSSERSSNRRG
ncbi:hypothetical protein LNQ49_06130 [Flavobacterium sp. F-65]|uniref:Uncharacterized protein n=1 Tax=Flavobacterium pisciphilum TaxID=2893755 RepID=A0ABS8MQY4_9FLAO|nr:hypothetical protein [Flavobacterium sp. F-65]MCC9071170.1 hypothetical protein [Flavobacterium sp. F-65]